MESPKPPKPPKPFPFNTCEVRGELADFADQPYSASIDTR